MKPLPRKVDKTEPATRIEAFAGAIGSVIIRSFSWVRFVNGLYGGGVDIEVQQVIDAASGQKMHGVRISAKSGDPQDEPAISYIDHDEIESLVRGIDYISGIDSTATKLERLEAEYKTRGGFRVCTFTDNDGTMSVAITAGEFYTKDVFCSLKALAEIKDSIVCGKQLLDEIMQ